MPRELTEEDLIEYLHHSRACALPMLGYCTCEYSAIRQSIMGGQWKWNPPPENESEDAKELST